MSDLSIVPAVPTLTATRYVQPLREGGSLPAVVETHEDGLWVVKFRGAGQGARVLVAELIVGLLARALDLPTPDLACVTIPERFGRSEPDPEIQDLLRASHGVNVGLRYLDGAFNYDAGAAGEAIPPEMAARIVWLDALTTNPDRTARNPNLLVWRRTPWLIDHGAALYFHHDWAGVTEARARAPFPLVERHVLIAGAGDVMAADAALAPRLDAATIAAVLRQVPDALLLDPVSGGGFDSADEARARYAEWFAHRLQGPRAFAAAAADAQQRVRSAPPTRLTARR